MPRKKKSSSYVLNYTVGNVAKRTGETRKKVSAWLNKQIRNGLGRCPFCPTALEVGSFAVDHMEPISRGGSRLLVNCHLTCQPCNRAKGDLTVVEFTSLLTFLKGLGERPMKSVLARLKIAGALYRGKG